MTPPPKPVRLVRILAAAGNEPVIANPGATLKRPAELLMLDLSKDTYVTDSRVCGGRQAREMGCWNTVDGQYLAQHETTS
jgi:hypothetical protein